MFVTTTCSLSDMGAESVLYSTSAALTQLVHLLEPLTHQMSLLEYRWLEYRFHQCMVQVNYEPQC